MNRDQQVVARKASALLAARLAELRSPRYTLLPHQVPPPGDWYGWLLLAGRGAGKTDACAEYMAQHVKGPPCLPGRTPHWMSIIAPTHGDAATSCVTGPSGIIAHDPSARMVTVQGGTVVKWPNGSQAKLFGASSLDDTERLRSGGNVCVREGSLIRTERGQVPIEQVTTNDRVWTRNGLRSVLWSGLTRPGAETLVIRTENGHRLELTPDHLVWVVGGGWIEARNVTPGCRMVAWNHHKQGRPHGTTGVRSSGAGTRTATTRTTTETCSTGNSGSSTSALLMTERCSTTATTTSRTTRSTTSRPSPERSIAGSIPRSRIIPTGSTCSPATEADSALTSCGTPGSPLMWPATGAGPYFSPRACAPSSAEEPAVLDVVVQSVEPCSTRVDTYDLTVQGDHEFFADDLIVHNCLAWLEELSAWRYLDEAWDQMRFGLRSGPRPRWIGSTTPKPRMLIKALSNGEHRDTVVTRASTYDNPHLPQHIKDALEERYQHTQLGRQELMGLVIDEDENALWTNAMIDAARIDPQDMPPMIRKTVGVDPSGGAGEQGIVVAGKSGLWTPDAGGKPRHHGFVLADYTCRLSPDGWGRRAVQAAIDHEADDITVEINYGRDMAVSTIRAAADNLGIQIPIHVVTATRGKRVRAEPVSALTEQKRWHHAGNFDALEMQLTTWYPELDWSPDRLDAMVWDAVALKLAHLGSGPAQLVVRKGPRPGARALG